MQRDDEDVGYHRFVKVFLADAADAILALPADAEQDDRGQNSKSPSASIQPG